MTDLTTAPQRRFQKATIEDVAALAGVTKGTVSLALSGRGRCTPETAERIRRAAADLHYVPSSPLRGLNRRATRTVGVSVLPRGSGADRRSFSDRLWNGIAEAADRAHYILMHYPEHMRNSSTAEPFLDGRIDGLILSVRDPDNRPGQLSAAGMPAVLINYGGEPPAGCVSIHANEADTADLALSHLWEMGHRRIAHLGGPVGLAMCAGVRDEGAPEASDILAGSGTAIDRCRGYEHWMQNRGVFDPVLLRFAHSWNFTPRAGKALALWRGLPDPPTAIFCANDELALSALAMARDLGWRVPGDLSIIGVDNLNAAALADVPLTSVDIPVEQIGDSAMTVLLRLMENAAGESVVSLPVRDLVIRESVAPPPYS